MSQRRMKKEKFHQEKCGIKQRMPTYLDVNIACTKWLRSRGLLKSLKERRDEALEKLKKKRDE